MSNKFLSVMEAIGKEAKAVLSAIEKYLPPAAALASVIFPAQTGTIAGVVNATDLIQKTVAAVEQKFAAAGQAGKTGPQKLADVLSIVAPTVTDLLTKEGVQVNSAYLTNVVNAVVAILNVKSTTVAA